MEMVPRGGINRSALGTDTRIFNGSCSTPPSLNSTESRTSDNLLALTKRTLAKFALAELTKRPQYEQQEALI